ncbi:MAG: hypothetical protein AUH92_01185 [Acidobacteria bacterium 13_1_40CM_4_69_4]|nr:MAG: hypothetical protein AUH92_01185 [Acidobacteria bacterium 13_1_40CM_4_69_4]
MASRRVLGAALATLCGLAAATGVAAREPPDERETRPIWGPAETVSFWSGGLTRSIDGDGSRLGGVCLAREIFDEAEADMGGGLWASIETGGGQAVIRTGFSYRMTLVKAGPMRIALRSALGIENRRRHPDAGLDGQVTGGLDLGFWISETVQMGFFGDRDFGFRSPTRNEVGVVLRIGRIR